MKKVFGVLGVIGFIALVIGMTGIVFNVALEALEAISVEKMHHNNIVWYIISGVGMMISFPVVMEK